MFGSYYSDMAAKKLFLALSQQPTQPHFGAALHPAEAKPHLQHCGPALSSRQLGPQLAEQGVSLGGLMLRSLAVLPRLPAPSVAP